MVFKKRIEEMKNKLAELHAEWDRLDPMGSQVEAQNKIADKIEELSNTIKHWTEKLGNKK